MAAHIHPSLFLHVQSIYPIAAFVGRMNGVQKSNCRSIAFSHDHLIGHFPDTWSSFGPKQPTFFLPVVQNKGQVDSPTDELVLSGEVEVAVQLQVSRPPLHPLLLDVWREK